MRVPNACFVPFEEIIDIVGGPEEIVACVGMQVEGEVPGTVLFVLQEKCAYYLVDILLGLEKGTSNGLDYMGESAIKEIGNLLTGSFIGATSSMTRLKIITTVPMFSFDMLGAILTSLLIVSGRVEEQVLLMETILLEEETEISGQFFFFTEPGALKRLFEVLKVE